MALSNEDAALVVGATVQIRNLKRELAEGYPKSQRLHLRQVRRDIAEQEQIVADLIAGE